MTNDIYQPYAVEQLVERIDTLHPDSQAQWGKMNVAQMLAHCSNALSMAVSEDKGSLTFTGVLFGWMAKKMIQGEQPFKQNLPTAKDFVVVDKRDFAHEKQRLKTIIDILAERGQKGVMNKVHPFFGKMSVQEWSSLIYKHIDHHLRQFGA